MRSQMTVQQLIDELSKFDPQKDVFVFCPRNQEDGYCDLTEVEEEDDCVILRP